MERQNILAMKEKVILHYFLQYLQGAEAVQGLQILVMRFWYDFN